jgi:hypothetical protein
MKEKNAKVNVLIHNLEWKIPTTQAIGWHPIVEAIPFNSNPKMGKRMRLFGWIRQIIDSRSK